MTTSPPQYLPSSRRQLLRWIALLLLLVVPFDQIAGRTLDRLRRRVYQGAMFGTINSALSARPAVLIVGSSAAAHHFDDKSLSEQIGRRVYNAGSDGRGIVFGRGLVALLCKEQRLDLVVVDVKRNADELARSQPSLAPYLDESPVIHDILMANWRNRILLLSRSFRYNGSALPMLSRLRAADPPMPWGFSALTGTYHEGGQEFAAADLKSHGEMKWYASQLDGLISEARACGATLLFVESPVFTQAAAQPDVVSLFRTAATRDRIEYLDLSSDRHPELVDPLLFYDSAHMNGDGARLATRYLADAVIPLLRKPLMDNQALTSNSVDNGSGPE